MVTNIIIEPQYNTLLVQGNSEACGTMTKLAVVSTCMYTAHVYTVHVNQRLLWQYLLVQHLFHCCFN